MQILFIKSTMGRFKKAGNGWNILLNSIKKNIGRPMTPHTNKGAIRDFD